MSLIDRYIHATTKSLPPDVRADVADELRATIEDELEAKGSRSKKHIEEVLTELGDPSVLAYQYKGGNNYLIGPDLFYLYTRVLKLVLTVTIPIVFIVLFAVGFGNNLQSLLHIFGYAIGNTVVTILHILFWVTAVFFVMERSGLKNKDLTKDMEAWTPAKLPQVPAKRQIPLTESVSELVAYTLLAVSPFLAPVVVGAVVEGTRIELFASELWSNWTMIIVALGLAGILLAAWKIRTKKWTTGLTIFNVLYAVISSAVLLAILFTTPVVSEAFTQLILDNSKGATPTQVGQWVTWSVAITFIVSVGIYLYGAGVSIWQTIRSKRS